MLRGQRDGEAIMNPGDWRRTRERRGTRREAGSIERRRRQEKIYVHSRSKDPLRGATTGSEKATKRKVDKS